jgi:hypothetical protein
VCLFELIVHIFDDNIDELSILSFFLVDIYSVSNQIMEGVDVVLEIKILLTVYYEDFDFSVQEVRA